MNNLLNIIILLGTIQGIITSILLFRLKINKKANKLLAWIILLISLACLNIYFLETLVNNDATIFSILEATIPLVIIMPIGPLIYFYTKSILNPDFRIRKEDKYHFFSGILDIIPQLTTIICIIGVFLGFIHSYNYITVDNFIGTYTMYVDIPRWISLVIYLWLSYTIIKSYKNKKNKTIVKWVRHFIIGFAIFSIIWLFHLVPYIIPSLSNILLDSVGWYPIYIPLIVLVYWLGINGYIISFNTYKKESNSLEISKETITTTISALEDLMKNEQLYLNPSLKLSDVVQKTGIPQKTISAVLNKHVSKSFNEYINTYRIEALKVRLLEEKSEKYTITGIAFECGFNSQATFQRAFKAITNQSPSEFRKTHLKK
ncbi:helix-turn-helix domain-containing protein [uncultured Aquimarina sp.]|uniref:helix-turn-helix domain-containing protein n=1 Tax=uncultured Aquimarina sp. TaxID=575652 RepID=UPI0026347C8E|nr:helix-turn-helix domain-containing protein [uncultured Aquimarina sp.]